MGREKVPALGVMHSRAARQGLAGFQASCRDQIRVLLLYMREVRDACS